MVFTSLIRTKRIVKENSWYFCLALLIRLVFAPITGHPYDLPVWINTGISLANGISPYTLHIHVGQTILWPLWLALCYITTVHLEYFFGYHLVYYIFLIKLLPIFVDLLLPVQMILVIENYDNRLLEPKKIKYLLILILFNPVFIIASSFWALIDNLSLRLILLSIHQTLSSHVVRAGILTTLAISLKLYPIIFVPPIAIFILWKTTRLTKSIIFTLTALFGFLFISYAPFYVFSWNTALITSVFRSQLTRTPGGTSIFGIITNLSNNLLLKNYFLILYRSIIYFTLLDYLWLVLLILFSLYLLFLGPKDWLPVIFKREGKISYKKTFDIGLDTLIELCIIYFILWFLTAFWISEQNIVPFLGLIIVYYFHKDLNSNLDITNVTTIFESIFKPLKDNRSLLYNYIQISLLIFLFISFNVPLFNFFYFSTTIFTSINYNGDFQFLRSIMLVELAILLSVTMLKLCVTKNFKDFLSKVIMFFYSVTLSTLLTLIGIFWIFPTGTGNFLVIFMVFIVFFVISLILMSYLKNISYLVVNHFLSN